jgi:hypothetical protein
LRHFGHRGVARGRIDDLPHKDDLAGPGGLGSRQLGVIRRAAIEDDMLGRVAAGARISSPRKLALVMAWNAHG